MLEEDYEERIDLFLSSNTGFFVAEHETFEISCYAFKTFTIAYDNLNFDIFFILNGKRLESNDFMNISKVHDRKNSWILSPLIQLQISEAIEKRDAGNYSCILVNEVTGKNLSEVAILSFVKDLAASQEVIVSVVEGNPIKFPLKAKEFSNASFTLIGSYEKEHRYEDIVWYKQSNPENFVIFDSYNQYIRTHTHETIIIKTWDDSLLRLKFKLNVQCEYLEEIAFQFFATGLE